MKKWIRQIGIVFAITTVLAGCGASDEEASNGENATEVATTEGSVIATVNGEEITEQEFQEILSYVAMESGIDIHGEEGQEVLTMMEDQLLDQLIDQMLLTQDAKEKGFEADDSEIAEQIDLIKEQSQVQSDEEFYEMLAQQNVTIAELEEQYRQTLTFDNYTESIRADIAVTEDEIESFYDELVAQHGEEVLEQDEINFEEELIKQKVNNELTAIITDLRESSEIIIH
ncbi:SurA N-terminal domain-containing protein [Alkalihalobacillus sp. LMS39]|uniref:SurA N-terminal domain-containing protein n=1 Tax=Alkalihalobacillus sp. LMS39 TaxID=2924032 RepID=UPI001FB2044B|nr:SurA N-terminal domain-containing protein [Alkalihalobacillus sp. LMS39]UOE95428.1 SurA N-terminal domain-containing protein [Alkalihalobacillus sp. LMS39]